MEIYKNNISCDLHLMVDLVGIDKFLEICKMYGGANVYIPVYKKATIGQRNKDIIKEYNGKNLKTLGFKYGICNQQIRHILKEAKVL